MFNDDIPQKKKKKNRGVGHSIGLQNKNQRK